LAQAFDELSDQGLLVHVEATVERERCRRQGREPCSRPPAAGAGEPIKHGCQMVGCSDLWPLSGDEERARGAEPLAGETLRCLGFSRASEQS
jgi:hypothetical protein